MSNELVYSVGNPDNIPVGINTVTALVKTQNTARRKLTVTALADSGGSLSGVSFWFFTPTNSFYVWYNVDGDSIDPNPDVPDNRPSAKFGIEVVIAENDNHDTVASNTRNAISNNPYSTDQVDVSGADEFIIITPKWLFDVKDAVDEDSGFTLVIANLIDYLIVFNHSGGTKTYWHFSSDTDRDAVFTNIIGQYGFDSDE